MILKQLKSVISLTVLPLIVIIHPKFQNTIAK